MYGEPQHTFTQLSHVYREGGVLFIIFISFLLKVEQKVINRSHGPPPFPFPFPLKFYDMEWGYMAPHPPPHFKMEFCPH